MYRYYDVFFLLIFSYVSQSTLVFTQDGIRRTWKRFVDNILRTMITKKKGLIVLSTANQVFAVLVAYFHIDDWRTDAERNQSTVGVMKKFNKELDLHSDASMLIGNNARLVRPIR